MLGIFLPELKSLSILAVFLLCIQYMVTDIISKVDRKYA
jgi:hypothetical protein